MSLKGDQPWEDTMQTAARKALRLHDDNRPANDGSPSSESHVRPGDDHEVVPFSKREREASPDELDEMWDNVPV